MMEEERGQLDMPQGCFQTKQMVENGGLSLGRAPAQSPSNLTGISYFKCRTPPVADVHAALPFQ